MQGPDADFLQEQPNTTTQSTFGLKFTLTIAVLSLTAAEPALARQTGRSAIYGTDSHLEMSAGFFQLTTGLGILGLAVVCQAEYHRHHYLSMLEQQATNGQSREEEDDA